MQLQVPNIKKKQKNQPQINSDNTALGIAPGAMENYISRVECKDDIARDQTTA